MLVTALDDDVFRIDVASRDRRGLLATVSGVLADRGLDVLDAVVATWGDGAAIESFRVRRMPDAEGAALEPESLEHAITAAFDQPIESAPIPGAEISFDDAASPWYTLCEVRSADRPGLLSQIAVALVSAGASVASARLETVDGVAIDRFELTDANERKLDRETKDAIRAAIRRGAALRQPRTPRPPRAGLRAGNQLTGRMLLISTLRVLPLGVS